MASVTYEHVTKRFGDVVAINGLSLEVADKEFLVLVGPSGCGKTTALRLLAGLEETTEGKIYIGDRLVNDVAPKDRDIAMVFQSYALYPHMSVYDNMAFGLKLRKTPKAEIDARVKEAAGILGIEKLLDRKPKQLSGGQRQRVALGRAIVQYDLKEDRFSAGEASWYAEPNNVVDLAAKIEQLLADETERTKMGALGWKRMKESLAWHHQAPRLLAAYQQTLSA